MNDIFSPIKRNEKLSDRVADKIQQLILSRKISPGDRLPTERELGETFQVSRTVIREAICSLEAQGLVESQTGSGTYVKAVNAKDVSTSLGLFLSTQEQGFTIDSLMEVRRLIEIHVIQLVAKNAKPADIHKLESILQDMCQSTGDIDAFSAWDLEYHITLAEASGNPLFSIMLEPLAGILLDFIWTGTSTPGAAEEACEFHLEILKFIKEKNAEKAADAMQAHLDQSLRVTVEGIKQRKELDK